MACVMSIGNTELEETDTHKHLGLTIQSNCKWDSHINNLTQKITLLVSCLKSYKYRLSRSSLTRIYKTFILPHFDYCDIIYDNCTQNLSDKLEKLHLEAIRTIIGAVKGTSHEKLYSESGFTTLKERRNRHKLVMMHKIIHNNCPEYLNNLCPRLVADVNPYHRRRPMERQVPKSNSKLHSDSFFPSTTKLYNDIPDDVKNNPSISSFKRYLSNNDKCIPIYFLHGTRTLSICHTRLRLGISNLNYDLFRRHLQENPDCECGASAETAEHYLLHCPNYTGIRNTTILTLDPPSQNIQTLLHGSQDMSNAQNTLIFEKVQEFISLSGRL